MKPLASLILASILALAAPQPGTAACQPEPVTPDTPTGISGCLVFGDGVASHYGPGSGAAMNFCTWQLRHRSGCGHVRVTAHETGITLIVPVIDFGDLYTGTPDERIIDLQDDVVRALGLDLADGLYEVTVWPEPDVPGEIRGNASSASSTLMPDTAVAGSGPAVERGTGMAGFAFLIALCALIASRTARWLASRQMVW